MDFKGLGGVLCTSRLVENCLRFRPKMGLLADFKLLILKLLDSAAKRRGFEPLIELLNL
jgi:hypothetical protein